MTTPRLFRRNPVGCFPLMWFYERSVCCLLQNAAVCDTLPFAHFCNQQFKSAQKKSTKQTAWDESSTASASEDNTQ